MSALISSQILQLASADGLWRAEVSPVGASLVSLWFDGIEIVTSPYHKAHYAVAGVIMAPWPNRLEDGRWSMGDREFTAAINDGEGHNANHGLVLARKFDVVEQSESRLQLQTDLFNAAAYPFEVSLKISYELTSEGMQIEIEARNLDASAVPIAFGMHPYFVCDENSQIEIGADTWISKTERNLPLLATAIEESPVAQRGFNLVQDLDIDDCFTDLDSESEGHVTRLSRPNYDMTVELWQSNGLSHLMIYKFTEDDEQERVLLAIEPQSAPANAFRNLDQVKILEPSELFSANCKITRRKNS